MFVVVTHSGWGLSNGRASRWGGRAWQQRVGPQNGATGLAELRMQIAGSGGLWLGGNAARRRWMFEQAQRRFEGQRDAQAQPMDEQVEQVPYVAPVPPVEPLPPAPPVTSTVLDNTWAIVTSPQHDRSHMEAVARILEEERLAAQRAASFQVPAETLPPAGETVASELPGKPETPTAAPGIQMGSVDKPGSARDEEKPTVEVVETKSNLTTETATTARLDSAETPVQMGQVQDRDSVPTAGEGTVSYGVAAKSPGMKPQMTKSYQPPATASAAATGSGSALPGNQKPVPSTGELPSRAKEAGNAPSVAGKRAAAAAAPAAAASAKPEMRSTAPTIPHMMESPPKGPPSTPASAQTDAPRMTTGAAASTTKLSSGAATPIPGNPYVQPAAPNTSSPTPTLTSATANHLWRAATRAGPGPTKSPPTPQAAPIARDVPKGFGALVQRHSKTPVKGKGTKPLLPSRAEVRLDAPEQSSSSSSSPPPPDVHTGAPKASAPTRKMAARGGEAAVPSKMVQPADGLVKRERTPIDPDLLQRIADAAARRKWSALRVSDLKIYLKQHGAPHSGRKAQLVEQAQALWHNRQEQATPTTSTTTVRDRPSRTQSSSPRPRRPTNQG
ncbi:hypothetical protein CDCA_CDCA12G3509 [Cyanidium caldarium]|uniref:SAP domain-containing protein n=1 Tax=Cyanidium caldarium TaxID=2771 RepID=A0AAV9IZI4_CYACA|nr:hypothetical protein CDCA_CDCA12G3509 [Cyanidium caldarium]